MPTPQKTEVITGGWEATAAQRVAAIAANEALKKGADPIAAAKLAMQSDADAAEGAAFRRYLLAASRLGHGRFDGLNTLDLYDVAALVALPMQSFEEWKQLR